MFRFSIVSRSFVNKVVPMSDVLKGVQSGQRLFVGGFGVCGQPNALLQEVLKTGIDNLTVVASSSGIHKWGLGPLFASKRISKLITSYVGDNKKCSDMYIKGDLDVEFAPQGSLAERIRCGGAGIPGFYTPTAVGTLVQSGQLPVRYGPDGSPVLYNEPRETRLFDNKLHILEPAIKGDVALIKAWKGDRMGNLVFRATARNFNEVMGKAAKMCIVEVEELVENGDIRPDQVHLPAVYVDRIVQPEPYASYIEHPTLSRDTSDDDESSDTDDKPSLESMRVRERIARRAALEFRHGTYVNLGVGLPTITSNYVPKGVHIELHSENGILGMGPFPSKSEDMSADLINAGKETITSIPGSSTFTSEESFAMVRGCHLDMTVLGAMEVASNGDLANWIVPEKRVTGMGGVMDLVSAGMPTLVLMTHCTKAGAPKVVQNCLLPLSGARCVDRIITELAVFDVDKVGSKGLTLVELAPGITQEQVMEKTAASFRVSPELRTMKYSSL